VILTNVISDDESHTGVFACCSEVVCRYPGHIDNGYVPPSSYFTYGSTPTYFCHRGYRLVNEEPLLCAANGSWVGRKPHCQRNTTSFILFCTDSRYTLNHLSAKRWCNSHFACHKHTTNLATGVSRQPVLDCGTIFHPDCGNRDFPSILSDDL